VSASIRNFREQLAAASTRPEMLKEPGDSHEAPQTGVRRDTPRHECSRSNASAELDQESFSAEPTPAAAALAEAPFACPLAESDGVGFFSPSTTR